MKKYWKDWAFTALCILLSCIPIAICYPWPATATDSFGYVRAAMENRFLVFRPFGYSVFLRAVHFISHSVTAVFVAQALLYWASASLLLVTLKRFYPPRRNWTFRLLEALVAVSPAAIFMLNSLMADALLCSSVFVMLAMFIVMLRKQSVPALVFYLAAFFVALHTRYSAMFFPLAFIPVLAFHRSRVYAFAGMGLTLAVFLVFRSQMRNEMYESVGMKQFSTGFDGWQLANNAMHILPFLDEKDLKKMPAEPQMRTLHSLCLRRYDKAILKATEGGKRASSAFLWHNDLPLKQHLQWKLQTGGGNYVQEWVRLGSGLYSDYGKWLILNYPGKFLRYYLLPNIPGIFFPADMEIVGRFAEIPAGKEEMTQWFGVPDDLVLKERNGFFRKNIRPLLPWIELITWILFTAAAVALLFRKGIRRETKLVLWALFLFGFIWYGTTTGASPVVLRYWMPMHAVKLAFIWIALTARN